MNVFLQDNQLNVIAISHASKIKQISLKLKGKQDILFRNNDWKLHDKTKICQINNSEIDFHHVYNLRNEDNANLITIYIG